MPVPRRLSTALAIAGSFLLVATLAMGCAGDQQPQNVGAESGPVAAPAPTDPSAYESYISGEGDDKAVMRKSMGNDLKVDVLVRVSYVGGAVAPPELRDVKAEVKDEIKIEVRSDEPQTVKVSGYPDASADVVPGEPEDVEFTVGEEGRVKVTLEPAGVTLLTFAVVG